MDIPAHKLHALLEADLVQSRLTGGTVDWREAWEVASALGWPSLPDGVLVVALDHPPGTSRRARQVALRQALAAAREGLQRCCPGGACLVEGEQVALALCAGHEAALRAAGEAVLAAVDPALPPGTVATVGLGGRHPDPAELPGLLAQAQQACAARLALGTGQVLDPPGRAGSPGQEGRPLPPAATDACEAALLAGDAGRFAAAVAAYLRADLPGPRERRLHLLRLVLALGWAALQAGVSSDAVAALALAALERLAAADVPGDLAAEGTALARSFWNEVAARREREGAPAIAAAREYIHRHFREPLRLKDVAEAAHLSLFHLCRLFHREMGCTVGEYVARLRMQEAERLLATTRLPVEEIARRVGYRKASAFAERFRAHTGMTPAAYRRQRGREGSEAWKPTCSSSTPPRW